MKVRASISLVAASSILASISQVAAAPAPQIITLWETAIQVTNTDGSIYTNIGPSLATLPVVTTSTTSIPTTSAVSMPTSTSNDSFSLDSLIISGFWQKWLSYFGISSSSNSDNGVIYSSATSSNYATVPTSTYIPKTSTSTTLSYTEIESTSGIYDEINDSSGIDVSFSKQILDAHNEYRALHGVGQLSWDKDVYEYAQAYADNYDCSGILTHSHGRYGENLAAGYSNGPAAVKAWYDEGESYDYVSADTYDHFTQVVWKGTTKLGCAYKDCSAENWGKYIICSYDPAGNIIGNNKANVLQLVSST